MINLDEAGHILRAIESSLRDVPLYLLSEHEWHLYDRGFDCLGYTAQFLDVSMADYLSERGRWSGGGFAAVLFLDRIGCRTENLIGVLLHELAHWAQYEERISRFDEAPLCSKFARNTIAEATAERDASLATLPPWHGHGLDFVRSSVHLWHRATRVCPEIKPFHLNYSDPYYYCEEHVWPALLGDELYELEDVPIRSIREHAVPERMRQFWESLTAWWTPINQPNVDGS